MKLRKPSPERAAIRTIPPKPSPIVETYRERPKVFPLFDDTHSRITYPPALGTLPGQATYNAPVAGSSPKPPRAVETVAAESRATTVGMPNVCVAGSHFRTSSLAGKLAVAVVKSCDRRYRPDGPLASRTFIPSVTLTGPCHPEVASPTCDQK